jgi:hypothetical protein
MIGAVGIFAGPIASAHNMVVAAWILAGALPASIWLSGRLGIPAADAADK